MNELRAVVLDILNDVTIDALVTVAHAEEMADEIVAALRKRGLTITEVTPDEQAPRLCRMHNPRDLVTCWYRVGHLGPHSWQVDKVDSVE